MEKNKVLYSGFTEFKNTLIDSSSPAASPVLASPKDSTL